MFESEFQFLTSGAYLRSWALRPNWRWWLIALSSRLKIFEIFSNFSINVGVVKWHVVKLISNFPSHRSSKSSGKLCNSTIHWFTVLFYFFRVIERITSQSTRGELNCCWKSRNWVKAQLIRLRIDSRIRLISHRGCLSSVLVSLFFQVFSLLARSSGNSPLLLDSSLEWKFSLLC